MICHWCSVPIKNTTGFYFHIPGFNNEKLLKFLCKKCASKPDVAKIFIEAGVFNNED